MCRLQLIAVLLLIVIVPCSVSAQNNDDDKKIIAPSQIYSPLGAKPQSSDKDLAIQYYASGDYAKAAVLYEKLYNEEPNTYYYRYLYYSLLGLGEYDKAIDLAKKAKRKDARNKVQYQIDEAYVHIISGNASKGYKVFDNAIKSVQPKQLEITLLASSFVRLHENKYAIKTYLKGRELLNDKKLYCVELSDCYFKEKEYKKSVKELVDFAMYNPKMINLVYTKLERYMDNDADGMVTSAIREELMLLTREFPNSSIYSDLMLWFSLQDGDFDLAFLQVKASDKRNDEEGFNVLEFALVCCQNGAYKIAQDAYNYVIAEYSKDNAASVLLAQIGLVDLEYELLQLNENYDMETVRDLDAKFTSLLKETEISVDMYSTVVNSANLKAFYLKDYQGAIDVLAQLLEKCRRAADVANIKLAMGDIYLSSGDPWEAILLYSQVEKLLKDEPLGHEAKYRNALVSYYIGEFNWAAAKLDVLKASTEKLIANDAMKLSMFIKDNQDEDSVSLPLQLFAKADLAIFNKQYDLAFQYLDSASNVNAWSVIEDDALMRKAEILVKKHKYKEADSVLSIIGEKYSDEMLADEALFTRAYINDAFLNDNTLAEELYMKVVLDYPDSIFAIAARDNYRRLRGDENVRTIDPNDEIIYVPIFKK